MEGREKEDRRRQKKKKDDEGWKLRSSLLIMHAVEICMGFTWRERERATQTYYIDTCMHAYKPKTSIISSLSLSLSVCLVRISTARCAPSRLTSEELLSEKESLEGSCLRKNTPPLFHIVRERASERALECWMDCRVFVYLRHQARAA